MTRDLASPKNVARNVSRHEAASRIEDVKEVPVGNKAKRPNPQGLESKELHAVFQIFVTHLRD